MAATNEQQRKRALAEEVAAVFIKQGSTGASLRDIADITGTSARMLIHYFASREALVDAAIEVARERQLSCARKWIVGAPDVATMLDNVWRWYQRPDTRSYFALFTSVAATERSRPAKQHNFGRRFVTDWIPMFEEAFRNDPNLAPRSKELAQIVIATIRGFAHDVQNGARPSDQRAAYKTLTELILMKART